MSFSSLPPELVHQIIESTVPHTFHSTTYPERQRTLCSLSLVSKLFRSIAQPLLLEIVKLKRVEDAEKLPMVRAMRENARSHGFLRWVIMDWDEPWYDEQTQEEKDRFEESLRIFETVRNLVVAYTERTNFTELLSTTFSHLAHLQLSTPYSKPLEGIHLPNLRDLALKFVLRELFKTLLDPANVPNLRNFAVVDAFCSYRGRLKHSNLARLIPQLQTLCISASIWSNPQVAFVHSAASRTLVDFDLIDTEYLDPHQLEHLRIRNSSVRTYAFNPSELRSHLDQWSSLIENNPSLPLKSVYLDSSLRPLDVVPAEIRLCLGSLIRLCRERKIDLVYDDRPLDYTLDPYISGEFVRRQAEQRRQEAEDRGAIEAFSRMRIQRI
ncbi:hypothetical protein JCM5350_002306 [Sporobolomyces pararoseus]